MCAVKKLLVELVSFKIHRSVYFIASPRVLFFSVNVTTAIISMYEVWQCALFL